jgi:outer membrane PBP1 activator LpoA protein
MMKGQGIVALGFVVFVSCWLLTSSTLAQPAQPAPPSNPGGLEAVVRELRLLREALQSHSNATARAQLLVARLAQQDQRTARARQAVDKLQSELAGTQRERDQLQSLLVEKSRQRQQAADQQQTERIDLETRPIRGRIDNLQRELSAIELRLSEPMRALDIEVSRQEELDRLLTDMDKQLNGER